PAKPGRVPGGEERPAGSPPPISQPSDGNMPPPNSSGPVTHRHATTPVPVPHEPAPAGTPRAPSDHPPESAPPQTGGPADSHPPEVTNEGAPHGPGENGGTHL